MVGLIYQVAIQRRNGNVWVIPVPDRCVALALQVCGEGPNEALLTPGCFNDLVRDGDLELFDVLSLDANFCHLAASGFHRMYDWQAEALPDSRGSCGEGVFIRRVSVPYLDIAPTVVRHTLAIIIGVDCSKVGEFPGNAARVTETVRIWTFGVYVQGSENPGKLNDRGIGAAEST